LKSFIKNIFTAIVALTLLIGTTGFQVYKHTCAVHNFSDISIFETPKCEKDHQVVEETDNCCKAELEEINEPNCCETEPINESYPVSITSQDINCCISSIGTNQMQDNLFPPIEKKILLVELITPAISVLEITGYQPQQNLVLENNNLPPPKFGKQLLQTIHQLKINTPVC
jgi:hypothetical protein